MFISEKKTVLEHNAGAVYFSGNASAQIYNEILKRRVIFARPKRELLPPTNSLLQVQREFLKYTTVCQNVVLFERRLNCVNISFHKM